MVFRNPTACWFLHRVTARIPSVMYPLPAYCNYFALFHQLPFFPCSPVISSFIRARLRFPLHPRLLLRRLPLLRRPECYHYADTEDCPADELCSGATSSTPSSVAGVAGSVAMLGLLVAAVGMMID